MESVSRHWRRTFLKRPASSDGGFRTTVFWDCLEPAEWGWCIRQEDVKLGRQVAIKLLPEELEKNPEALARFEREARAASALNHPNICTVYEVEEYEAQPFIVLELLQGES